MSYPNFLTLILLKIRYLYDFLAKYCEEIIHKKMMILDYQEERLRLRG